MRVQSAFLVWDVAPAEFACVLVRACAYARTLSCMRAIQVRKKEQLEGLDGLVIPGGESTGVW